VYAYDDSFIDMLIESGIPGLLKETTGYELTLGHIQLRRVWPKASYMDWHRDTHFLRGEVGWECPAGA